MNKETKKQTILGYLFLIPSLAVFAVFMFYPLLYTFYLSFFEWNMVKPVKKFVGLNNYIAVFRDPNTFKILGNTLAYILVLLVLNFVLPYILSFILSAVIRHGKSFYKAVFFLPSVISLVVGSILYTWILNPISGPVAIILGKFGIQMPFWSKTDGWVIAVLCIITTWKTFGYNFINILAGVSGVSQEVIEAARLDQVPMWKIFLGLQYVFTPIKVITQGGPNYASSNLIYASYHEAFTLYRTGTSSAISILTMLLFIVLLLLEFKFVEKGVYYEN